MLLTPQKIVSGPEVLVSWLASNAGTRRAHIAGRHRPTKGTVQALPHQYHVEGRQHRSCEQNSPREERASPVHYAVDVADEWIPFPLPPFAVSPFVVASPFLVSQLIISHGTSSASPEDMSADPAVCL